MEMEMKMETMMMMMMLICSDYLNLISARALGRSSSQMMSIEFVAIVRDEGRRQIGLIARTQWPHCEHIDQLSRSSTRARAAR